MMENNIRLLNIPLFPTLFAYYLLPPNPFEHSFTYTNHISSLTLSNSCFSLRPSDMPASDVHIANISKNLLVLTPYA